MHQTLWDDRVVPIIPLRNLTKPENQVLLPENQQRCSADRPLRFDGYESAREALRYDLPRDCPKLGGGQACEFADDCTQKLLRVSLSPDTLRYLGPVPRDSKQALEPHSATPSKPARLAQRRRMWFSWLASCPWHPATPPER